MMLIDDDIAPFYCMQDFLGREPNPRAFIDEIEQVGSRVANL